MITLTVGLFIASIAAFAVAGYASAMARWHHCSYQLFTELAEIARTQTLTSAHFLAAWNRHMPGRSGR